MARPKAPKRHVTTMRLRKDLYDRLARAALRQGISRTKAVEDALEAWLPPKRQPKAPDDTGTVFE
jgi:hypothetical protein